MVAGNTLSAVVLAGGKGTRLASVHPHTPKPLIPVAGEPFLHWVAAWLVTQGVREIVLSTGHLAEQIEQWADHCAIDAALGAALTMRCRRETTALGTGGGILNCADGLSDPFLAVNGDSLVVCDLAPLMALMRDPAVEAALIGIAVPDAARYGTLDVDESGSLRRFSEKQTGHGIINGGIYLLRRRLFGALRPGEPASMEYDVIPTALARGARIAVHVVDAPFLDIGTPESLARAERFIRDHSGRLMPAVV